MGTDFEKNILNDILSDMEQGLDADSIFRRYKPKNVIAKEMFNKLLERGRKRKQALFFLSDSNKKVGLLSVAQGLISLTLILQMENLDDVYTSEDWKESFAQNLLEVFRLIGYEDGTSELHFYATPFVDEKDQVSVDEEDDGYNYYDYDYVDAVCKTTQAIIECREFLSLAIDNQKEFGIYKNMQKLAEENKVNRYNMEFIGSLKSDQDVVKILNICLAKSIQKILDLKIENNSDLRSVKIGETTYNINCIGWNFTNKKHDSTKMSPSLFFTYTCTQTYLTFYKNFFDALLIYRRDGSDVKTEDKSLKIKRDYKWIIDHSELIEDFRKVINSCGLYLDEKIKKLDLRSKFLGLDYSSVDMNEIKNSTTNNALFNSVFAVAILIGSGVADIYDTTKTSDNRRYFEWLQSIIQNVYDSYCDLLAAKKDYAVSQYILNFNEVFPDELTEFANYLRKQRIQVLSLVPIMTRVYNMVSTYIINYPQKQMRDYLKLLMENRRIDNYGKYEWSWDKDNYDVNINAIYIGAMYDFYIYYEKFERPYIETDENNARLMQQIKDKEREGKDKLEKEQALHAEEIKKIEEEKKQIKEAQENSPLYLAMRELIKEEMEKALYEPLCKVFDEVTQYLCDKNAPYRYMQYDENAKDSVTGELKKEAIFADKLLLMLLSFFRFALVKDVNPEVLKSDAIKTYQDIINRFCYDLSEKVVNLSKYSKEQLLIHFSDKK